MSLAIHLWLFCVVGCVGLIFSDDGTAAEFLWASLIVACLLTLIFGYLAGIV